MTVEFEDGPLMSTFDWLRMTRPESLDLPTAKTTIKDWLICDRWFSEVQKARRKGELRRRDVEALLSGDREMMDSCYEPRRDL